MMHARLIGRGTVTICRGPSNSRNFFNVVPSSFGRTAAFTQSSLAKGFSSNVAEVVEAAERSSLYFRLGEQFPANSSETANISSSDDGLLVSGEGVDSVDDKFRNSVEMNLDNSIDSLESNLKGSDEFSGGNSDELGMQSIKSASEDGKMSESERKARSLDSRIAFAIKGNKFEEVLRLFNMYSEDEDMYKYSQRTARRVFKYCCNMTKAKKSNKHKLLSVFKKYKMISNHLDVEIPEDIWRSAMYALRAVDNRNFFPAQSVREIIWSFYSLAKEKDKEYQQRTFPSMLIALARQPNDYLHGLTWKIWSYMRSNGIEISIDTYTQILNSPVYNDRTNLPRHIVLSVMINEDGLRPTSPQAVLEILESYRSNSFSRIAHLTALVDSLKVLLEYPAENEEIHSYRIDEGLIEQMAVSGVSKQSCDYVLKLWDIMEILGYKPSERMYECAILSFFRSFQKDHHGFAALTDMESDGYVPSRALINSISRNLSVSVKRLDHAYYMLTKHEPPKGIDLSTSVLNCILAACAKEGLVDRSFTVFHEFERFDLYPDANSYSYLLECISNEIKQMKAVLIYDPVQQKVVKTDPYRSATDDFQIYVDSCVEVVSMMKDQGIDHTRHTLHEYVDALSCLGELDSAKITLENAIYQKERVLKKTIEHFCLQCALSQRKDLALESLSLFEAAGHESIPNYISDALDAEWSSVDSSESA